MLKKWWLLLPLAALAAVLMVSLSGCFKNPTNPFVNAFDGCTDGCTDGDWNSLNPVPTPGAGGGTGTISGTISGSNGETVTIWAVNTTTWDDYYTSRSGDGAYSIVGLPAGTYGVTADSINYSGYYMDPVTVTDGGTTTGINITLSVY